jgi:hypothetical protein
MSQLHLLQIHFLQIPDHTPRAISQRKKPPKPKIRLAAALRHYVDDHPFQLSGITSKQRQCTLKGEVMQL